MSDMRVRHNMASWLKRMCFLVLIFSKTGIIFFVLRDPTVDVGLRISHAKTVIAKESQDWPLEIFHRFLLSLACSIVFFRIFSVSCLYHFRLSQPQYDIVFDILIPFTVIQAMYEGILVDIPFATFFLSKLKQK